MGALPLREAARAVVLDADQRVLLLRYDENGGFWATPGDSLEPGGSCTRNSESQTSKSAPNWRSGPRSTWSEADQLARPNATS
ncbi:hypothetical protein AB0451_23560 [Streptomyces sp. NPDC052000]|uniref:hypothetical protein n=1 Tax=Streptomyces sp. NPDC052000 TaxID=3155676 RepID=UPI00344F612B